jgi:CO/xanthine dehydrogenase Mo-binding subunit
MSTVMKTTRDVKGIGLSIPRPDGPDKVTGQVQYVADLSPRGLLHAKLLRSPHAHAKIVRIDVSKAKALPGVRAVLTAADIPQLKKKAPTRAHCRARDRPRRLRGAAGRGRGRRRARDRRGSARPDRRAVRGSAGRRRSARVDEARRAAVAELGTEADTSEAQAHGSVAGVSTEAKPSKAVNISQQARLQRGDVREGLRRVRRGDREHVSRPDGPSGLHGAARGPGPVG